MKYKILKELKIGNYTVKPGSTIEILSEGRYKPLPPTWGEIKQVFDIIKKTINKKNNILAAKETSEFLLKLGINASNLGILQHLLTSVDWFNSIKLFPSLWKKNKIGKLTTEVTKKLAMFTMKNPNSPVLKNLTGPFWDVVRLSPGLSELISDEVELKFFEEIIEPQLNSYGNDNEYIPAMEPLFADWVNTKILGTSATKLKVKDDFKLY